MTASGWPASRAVVDKLTESHRDSIKLFEQQAATGTDGDLKAFAEKTLPTLREHLKMVEGAKPAAEQAAAKQQGARRGGR
jgi:putative membrane protein